MQKMLSQLRRCIDEYNMIEENDKIIVGVSGGKDSTVLLRLLAELRRCRFFHGELEAQTICIYHVPFSGEDEMHMRPVLANDMVKFPAGQEVRVLCDPFQRTEL